MTTDQTRFDSDPEALAWARAKAQAYIDQLADWERQADEREAAAKARGIAVARLLAERRLIGGRGCTIGAFDERRPELAGVLAASDATAAVSAPVQPPATDRAGLRDRIADVLLTTPREDYEAATDHRKHRYDARCALCGYEVDTLAAAVLAVLPEPAVQPAEFELRGTAEIRADVLREAADTLDARAATLELLSSSDDDNEGYAARQLRTEADQLRRMAGEEQPSGEALTDAVIALHAETGWDTPGCDCGHEGMGPKWHLKPCTWLATLTVPHPDTVAGEEQPATEAPEPPFPFFEPGHTYVREHHGRRIEFHVRYVDTAPDCDFPTAFGWRKDPEIDVLLPMDSDDFDGWTDATVARQDEAPR